MRIILIVWMCMLVACTPVAEEVKKAPVSPEVKEPVVAPSSLKEEPVTRTVKQTGSLGTFVYGLSEDNRILSIEKTGALWKYKYENGRLASISGPQNIDFIYNKTKLGAIHSGPNRLNFMYDLRDRLVEVKGAQETLHMDYDSIDEIRAVRRGIAGETSIDYDKKGKIKYLTRGPVTTNVYFDDRNRVRSFDAGDSKFILGYWRDDKLISLTALGPGVAVSYGPDYPPFEADVISASDNSQFTAAYTDTLYKVVDEYIYCQYVRALKDVLFEGTSYTVYVNYFKGDMAGYLAMQYRCIPYES